MQKEKMPGKCCRLACCSWHAVAGMPGMHAGQLAKEKRSYYNSVLYYNINIINIEIYIIVYINGPVVF